MFSRWIFPCFGVLLLGYVAAVEDVNYWRNVNLKELEKSMTRKDNTNPAKNVILFIGDGMSLPTLTAARFRKNQQKFGESIHEELPLTMETFPNVGLSRVYNIDLQTPDSASTASAIFTGVKTKYGTMGFDYNISKGDVETQINGNRVPSLMSWAQDIGKDTGFVTNTRVSHATPAASYAHIVERDWECDKKIPVQNRPDVEDITKQLVSNDPGRKMKVVLGGGRTSWTKKPKSDKAFDCNRVDELDLIAKFLNKPQDVPGFEDLKGKYIKNYKELKEAVSDVNSFDYILGLFSDSFMKYDSELDKGKEDREPTLVEMTELAIKVLSKNKDKGFFLLVEGGKIDHAHHAGEANNALEETIMLDNAIERAMELVDLEETLIIVTADHGHTMTQSGYANREDDIRGFAGVAEDGKSYPILSYANGKGFKEHYSVENGKIKRKTVSLQELQAPNFIHPATISLNKETHSGSDVGIFAKGPWSHLIHSVHEQTYINTVIAYSSCLGEFKEEPHCPKNKAGRIKTLSYFSLLFSMSCFYYILLA